MALGKAKMDEYVPRARKLLVAQAKKRRTVTYGSIQKGLGGRRYIGEVLDKLNIDERDGGRPMLSALVVNTDTGMPSGGFFDLARRLMPAKRNVPKRQLWEAERDAVYGQDYGE